MERRLQRLIWLALGHGVTVKDSRHFAIYLVSGVTGSAQRCFLKYQAVSHFLTSPKWAQCENWLLSLLTLTHLLHILEFTMPCLFSQFLCTIPVFLRALGAEP